jgi:polyphenol oxidase
VILRPDWAAPACVGAVMSTRAGGVSRPPFDSLNVGAAVGDDASAVAENRRRFAAAIGARPVWLRQVHGTRVVRIGAADAETDDASPLVAHADPPQASPLVADAAWTDEPGIACTVQVADCLPVLLCTADGRAVAAAHAGWRGLAAGVLEVAVRALCEGAGCAPAQVCAWLGPCIGPRHFEVGADVLQGFGLEPLPADAPCFSYAPRADGSARWRADLPALARARLQRAGVRAIAGGVGCTVSEASTFFSFRRDGVTGRLAAAVWRRGVRL